MLIFIIVLLIAMAFVGWVTFNIHSAEIQNNKPQPRKKTDTAFYINNLPANMPAEQKDFLRKVANFTGSDYVTPYNIQAFLADSTAKDFAKIPGWARWTADSHLMAGQEDRQKRALYSQTMRIMNFNPATGKAVVHGESGQDYDVNGNGCTCKDFQFRNLPCKHMYFVAFNINDNE